MQCAARLLTKAARSTAYGVEMQYLHLLQADRGGGTRVVADILAVAK